MLGLEMLSVIMLNVIRLSVVAPNEKETTKGMRSRDRFYSSRKSRPRMGLEVRTI
jgi:hypothetical protein